MPCFRIPCAALALAAGLSLSPLAAPPQQEALAVAAFVTAAADYLRQYKEDLTSVVARESYRQRVRVQTPRAAESPLERTLTSEIFFMFIERQGWMAIRDVLEVDGETLEGRPDLRLALAEVPASQVAARFKAYNARHNIGRVRRNFNEPTLALAVLDDTHRARFSFERARARRGDDLSLVRLTFRERSAPTLIRGLGGDSVFSSGEITLDPATGRITATRMAMKIGTIQVDLATTYAFDPKLAIAVPVTFTERYLDGAPGTDRRPASARHEEILCEARYSDFQRFAVQTRIR